MWYYADLSRQRQGPVSAEQLASLYAQGLVNAESLVWRQGMPNWQPLNSVAGELGLSAPAPYAAPPPPPPAPSPYGYSAPPTPYAHNPYAAPQADLGSGYADGDLSNAVPAGFWKRFAALVIDYFLLVVISLPIGFIFGMLAASGSGMSTGIELVSNLIGFAVGWAYYCLQESSGAMATVGKRARGLKVLRSDGTRISLARATGRYFAKILSGIILMIGFLMAAFTERKQGLHDMLADTLVVAENPDKARLDGIDFLLIAIGLLAPILIVVAIGVAAFAAMGGMR
ncbi:MAG: RDD family protein [Xanthomonadales bacterium]|jgi:uncharacterized RDD family membrane protein YckC|nr:RDD family protein [Xanthomonadales bacterium]